MIIHSKWFTVIGARMQAAAPKRSLGSLASFLFAATIPALAPCQVFAHVECPTPGEQVFNNPPELIRSARGILEGSIILKEEEHQRLPQSRAGNVTCSDVRVRNFRGETAKGEKLPQMRPAQPAHPGISDPEPGPTLRARVGDLVQLTFVNEVNPNNFEPNIDFKCTEVGEKGSQYPDSFRDKFAFPNCLHASSTANIHFHGTHTNPNTTGDNVYLQVRPLPRDNQGILPLNARAEATAGFQEFFNRCTEELQNPLNSWPTTWDNLPRVWTDKQKELLLAHQQKYPDQRLWDRNQQRLKDDWPIYYIGAFPYCFALPDYERAGGARPVMGQIPGTHWYHAHKHGSTAINVANGMAGAFIIEGKYDDDLNDAYRSYFLEKEGRKVAWNASSQPVLVLNQLATDLNPTSSLRPSWDNLDFVVNGRIRPKLRMQRGEVQLWRIVNTSSRSAAYFMPPAGLQWMQLAQDGVPLADANYQKTHNEAFYLAPANRVDLLVKAPKDPLTAKVQIKNVMARSSVSDAPAVELLTVEVIKPSVTLIDGQAVEMPFLSKAFELPQFLRDIDDDELKLSNNITRTLTFNSEVTQGQQRQHTINGLQFGEGHAEMRILLGAVEEWKIENATKKSIKPVDHPFHIHINPFQVTEFFDPNETFQVPDGRALPQYVFDQKAKEHDDQCFIDPAKPSSWEPCAKQKERTQRPWVWHDVFAMPSAADAVDKDGAPIFDNSGQQVSIPGYFKMRSRFVDFPGLYVMHCHILIHEDRGMMFSVEVVRAKPTVVQHH